MGPVHPYAQPEEHTPLTLSHSPLGSQWHVELQFRPNLESGHSVQGTHNHKEERLYGEKVTKTGGLSSSGVQGRAHGQGVRGEVP